MSQQLEQTPAAPAPDQSQPAPTTASPSSDQTPAAPVASASASTDLASEALAPAPQPTSDKPDAVAATDLGADDPAEADKPDPTAQFHGAPEGGVYTDFTLPDGFAADDALRAEFTPLAAELGLSQAGAQKLVDFKAKLDQRNAEVWQGHLIQLRTDAKADAEIGGSRYDESVRLGRSAITKFGTPALRAMLNNYGVGAHPEMIRFMAKIGRAIGETPAQTAAAPAPSTTPKAAHELFYPSQPSKET